MTLNAGTSNTRGLGGGGAGDGLGVEEGGRVRIKQILGGRKKGAGAGEGGVAG